MPEQMADAAMSLGGAMLFAWIACALAQFAALAPQSKRRAPLHAKPSCGHRVASSRDVSFTVSFALLVSAAPGMLAASFTQSAIAVAAAEAGALIGLRLAARSDFPRRVRAIAAVGCALGLAAICASVACMLVLPLQALAMRAAFYVSAILGALAFGAAGAAWRVASDIRTVLRHRVSPGRGERVLYVAALVLIVALGVRIAWSPASREFDASALGGACVLAAAWGVCLMGGARRTWRASGARIARAANDGSKRSAPSWGTVPDAWLVAACGPAAYEPANFDDWVCLYEPPAPIPQKIHRASRDSPRRRRRSSRRIMADH